MIKSILDCSLPIPDCCEFTEDFWIPKGVGVRLGKPITNEITELAAVLTYSTVDSRDQGHGREAVAHGDGITVAERGSEFGNLK